jgi:hypothetical protein
METQNRCRQDLDEFKTHFSEAHQELQEDDNTTSQAQGYHAANLAVNQPANDTALAFANLATAQASDRQMMVDLASTNKGLLKKISEKDAIINCLQHSNKPPTGALAPNPRQNADQRPLPNNTNYCWTHG